ncbi:hypothetical protein Hoch_0272 [Haliangium ochraceum DSM 14365]|uniref:Essential protein Yae1 N-terminal domain-containing protein n=1 Tax=Haliangium ochraceum (strain DSM 14365 / JCM 11303 / SMP-2) TaxID=502025 RepID=D0LHQ1_HALO1|nr:hypothetical protein Hoch_0272 [Haliangium ochraceum DSM 14365]
MPQSLGRAASVPGASAGVSARVSGQPAAVEAERARVHGLAAFVLHAHLTEGHRLRFDPSLQEGPAGYTQLEIERLAGNHSHGGVELVFFIAVLMDSSPDTAEAMTAACEARARELIDDGVRRVFVLLERWERVHHHERLREWVPGHDSWRPYASDGAVIDACLHAPLPVRAFWDEDDAERAVAGVLIDKSVDIIEDYGLKRHAVGREAGYRSGRREGFDSGKDEGYRAGKDEGYRVGKSDGFRAGRSEGYAAGALDGVREAIFLLLRSRGVVLEEAAYARLMRSDDAEALQRWLTRAAHAVSSTELFDDA